MKKLLKENNKFTHFNLGLNYKAGGSTAEAKYHFKRAIELGHERAKTALESLLSQEKVKPVFQPKTIRNDHLRSFNRGNSFYFAGEFEKAIGAYKEAIRIKPDYERAYFVLGEVYKSNGQRNEAKEAFVNALRFKSNDNITHFNLGLLYKEEGNTEKARYHINQALILGHKQAERELESLMTSEKKNEIPKPKPVKKDHWGFFEKGNVYYFAGKYQEAIHEYQEAIRIQPDFEKAYLNLSLAFGKIGQKEKAVEAMSKAVKSKLADIDMKELVDSFKTNEKNKKWWQFWKK